VQTFAVPSTTNFEYVANTLDAHCGTLDCHGASGRNFRMYGYSGRRLDPKDVSGGLATTPREVGADYCSLTSLEPEILAAVVAEGGARPERLTFIRKARGAESHTGGTVFPAGSDGDKCLTLWLAGKGESASCDNSLSDFDRPPAPAPPVNGVAVDVSACNRPTEER